MSRADDAREAIRAYVAAGMPNQANPPQDYLAATLPDGRTAAEHLDRGEAAERLLAKFSWHQDGDGWYDVHGVVNLDHGTPDAALLASLAEAPR